MVKKAVAVPAWTQKTKNAPETLVQLKRQQTGQFYYGFPIWWAAAEWIRLANRVPGFHNNGLDTEYNVSKICRVAEPFIDKFGGDTDESKDAFRKKFYGQVDELLFGTEGKRKVIFDECAVGIDGKMQPYIEFETVESKLTGKEYTELYQMAVTAFANASGILSGLAGVSDGKMLGVLALNCVYLPNTNSFTARPASVRSLKATGIAPLSVNWAYPKMCSLASKISCSKRSTRTKLVPARKTRLPAIQRVKISRPATIRRPKTLKPPTNRAKNDYQID
ncbi:hypothetical protein HMF3257_00460 [Spirosoma telluris]|uniref:Uncharacterized protein n=1 Tax=Spirosoma telluris TaxID=2183553 RepID=A0A327NDM8_9BACT|nr:hypothetical protein HMF3257_00460 [Spirosoma telluris]